MASSLVAALVLCWLFFDSFVYWTSWILYWLWIMVDFAPTHLWVASKVNLLAGLANKAKTVSFDDWLSVMNQTSGILFLFLSPIVLMSPPTQPISATVGCPPRSSVNAGRSTSEKRPKSVASSDQPAQTAMPRLAGGISARANAPRRISRDDTTAL